MEEDGPLVGPPGFNPGEGSLASLVGSIPTPSEFLLFAKIRKFQNDVMGGQPSITYLYGNRTGGGR